MWWAGRGSRQGASGRLAKRLERMAWRAAWCVGSCKTPGGGGERRMEHKKGLMQVLHGLRGQLRVHELLVRWTPHGLKVVLRDLLELVPVAPMRQSHCSVAM